MPIVLYYQLLTAIAILSVKNIIHQNSAYRCGNYRLRAYTFRIMAREDYLI